MKPKEDSQEPNTKIIQGLFCKLKVQLKLTNYPNYIEDISYKTIIYDKLRKKKPGRKKMILSDQVSWKMR